MKKTIYTLILFIICAFQLSARSLSVVVVGGGPAGLAAAIECRLHETEVNVIEKREVYTRRQVLFLDAETLDLFDKWGVKIPELNKSDLGIGLVQIQALEEALDVRARELGVKKTYGEFTGFNDESQIINISSGEKSTQLAYDLLIGADGFRSSVREALSIKPKLLISAVGAIAIITLKNEGTGNVDISTAKMQDFFIRKISMGPLSIVFTQGPVNPVNFHKMVENCGWAEATIMGTDQARIIDNIPVQLFQASTFSNEKKRVLLLGDAIATVGFFEGQGANTAFKSAEIAGQFLENHSYSTYNQSMQRISDELICGSRYLFTDNNKLL